MRRIKATSLVLAGFLAIGGISGAAQAQERFAVQPGFAFPTDKQVKVAVLRPDIHVGSLGTGGVAEANVDWTVSARGFIADALKQNEKVNGVVLTFPDEPTGEDLQYLADYRALFTAVANAIMTHKLFGGEHLPTKKEAFDWTLGDGTQRISDMMGADYALFLYTNDAYGTAGRKVASLLLAGLAGVYVAPGVHIGYAGLVNLHTGEVVWLNADPQMGGDVRTQDGAEKRVGQLLNGLPGRVAPAAAAPAK